MAVSPPRYRGGATITERLWDGKRTTGIRSDAFDAQGRRVETVVTMPSDGPAVTNAVTTYDHLGRAVSVVTPLGVTSNFYDSASSRLIRVSRSGQPDTLYEYEVGSAGVPARTAIDVTTTAQDPIRSRPHHRHARNHEQDASNVWWRDLASRVGRDELRRMHYVRHRVHLIGLILPAPAALDCPAARSSPRRPRR